MIKTIETPPGLLFASYLFRSDLHSEADLREHWIKNSGEAEFFSPNFNPLFSYYEKEMGAPLGRFILLSKNLHPREDLLRVKLKSLEWENSWIVGGKRMVNVDIGLLSAENFLLATTKNYSHRVFLGHDIFAELTYQFQKGSFQTFPWTYPDYADQEKISFFTRERLRLLKQLQS